MDSHVAFFGSGEKMSSRLLYFGVKTAVPLLHTGGKILLSAEITKKIFHQASEEAESHFPVTCNPEPNLRLQHMIS